MHVGVSRDSVAAGDDVDSHDLILEVDNTDLLETVLLRLRSYLPTIWGGEASWVVQAGRRGRRLAVMAQQWDAPRPLVPAVTTIDQAGWSLHFGYRAQVDPESLVTGA